MVRIGANVLKQSPDEASPIDAREAERRDFLKRAGWEVATREPLAQDASTRRYERLTLGTRTAMLMDSPRNNEQPPCPPDADQNTRKSIGWNATSRLAASRVEAFVALANHLRAHGFSAPEILACDIDRGLAVVEDFGTAVFARIIENGHDEQELYVNAARTLASVHSKPVPSEIKCAEFTWPILEFDALALQVNADLFVEWLPHHDSSVTPTDRDLDDFVAARDEMIDQAMSFPRTLTLRDYHAENLIWLPEREGDARVGLLDFQDAVLGWGEWDMAMLIQDARHGISPKVSNAAIEAYLDRTGGTRDAFDVRLAVLGTLNALRIAGLFARLIQRDKKTRYLAFLPLQLAFLKQNLQSPAAARMNNVLRGFAPHLTA